jgi:hypothetical protein
MELLPMDRGDRRTSAGAEGQQQRRRSMNLTASSLRRVTGGFAGRFQAIYFRAFETIFAANRACAAMAEMISIK